MVKGDFCIRLLCLDWKHSFLDSRKQEKCIGQVCAHISEKIEGACYGILYFQLHVGIKLCFPQKVTKSESGL